MNFLVFFPLIMLKLLLIFTLLFVCECAKILAVFPTPSVSHHIVFRPYINELVRRGHNCVVITPDPVFIKKQPENLRQIDVHDVSYSIISDTIRGLTGDREDSLSIIHDIFYQLSLILDAQLQQKEVKEALKENYDLVIAEAYVRPVLGFAHLLKAPVILMSTYGGISSHYEMFGAPTQPLLYPYLVQQKLYNLGYFEKIAELWKYVKFEGMLSSMEGLDYEIMRRHFGSDVPSFKELYKNVQMLLLNEHHIWGDNHPVPLNIKHVGGLHAPRDRPLPQKLQKYLDASNEGVIYYSLGSNVKPSIFAPDKMNLILKVLSTLPYDILFKWDTVSPPTNFSKIAFDKWFPQSDLLKHPKVKLFITHGGLQSIDEAINAGVPLIGIPIFHDQHYNVEKVDHQNIGIQLDINTITENQLRDAVYTVVNSKRYKNNMLLLRARMREEQIQSLEQAAWWTEYILMHRGLHLTPLSAGMSWMEYYEIPLVLNIAFTLLLLTIVLILIILKLFKNI